MRSCSNQKQILFIYKPIATIIAVLVIITLCSQPRLAQGQTDLLTTPNHSLATIAPDKKPFQYVVFAFDGSRSLKKWRETLDFAKSMKMAGSPIHFTYFINAIYLVPEAHKHIYKPPPHKENKNSIIGYGSTNAEIGERITLINEAYQSGHEIGSHGVGHLPGYNWGVVDWKNEFAQFASILERSRKGIDTTVPLAVPASKIIGFRAPNLVINNSLYKTLDELGYMYDASRISKMGIWPQKIGTHWEMPLASIPYDEKYKTVSMDYNFYFLDSKAKDTIKKNTSAWQKKHDKMLAAYMNYFNTNYNSNRAPVFIGHHFTDWNDGLYWSVMQKAAKAMCSKPYVRCTTYKETMDYLDIIKAIN